MSSLHRPSVATSVVASLQAARNRHVAVRCGLLVLAVLATVASLPAVEAQAVRRRATNNAQPPGPAFGGTGGVASTRGLVVSASNLASDIGAAVLARGGNAVDAAVATAFALAVTHPSAGNIGGGGFMVVRKATGEATTFDFREKAPLSATATMMLNADGSIAYARTDSGWLAPGVPGTVRGMEMAHKALGRLAWRDVVAPAAQLAARGFILSPALAAELNEQLRTTFAPFPASVAAYGKKGGTPWRAGERLRLGDLARTLAAIAEGGADAFYTGWIADSLDAQMRANGGMITKRDLAEYRAVEREPLHGSYLGYEIIAMPPPSSGGTVLIEVLNQLEALGADRFARTSTDYLHLRIEAARRAYLDRARFLGDPDFGAIPVDRLTAKGYADSLARTIDPHRATSSVALGGSLVTTAETMQTTHFSVVDAEGNAVAVTYTLEGGYGSGVVVRGAGFILNNEMGDFNKKAGYTSTRGDIGTPPNLIAPGKRMLSSMTPTILARDGKLALVTGSPGGRTIPNTVLDVVLGVTAFKQSVRAAVDAPRVHHQWLPDETRYEAGAIPDSAKADLEGMGHRLRKDPVRSQGDAHSIWYDAATRTAYGANDKRSPDSKASVPARVQR
ncbi:MAG: gamma-glutamyltransferase [Gemmatimonadaceae bacterium]|nr:gamma-glutamyltransferase [Gemmatimonadaceae bacterium]